MTTTNSSVGFPHLRHLQFSNISPRTVTDLTNFLASFHATISDGIVEHQMGRLYYIYTESTKTLDVFVIRVSFPIALIVGGIRQHVQEFQERMTAHA